jgi:hypothetical protein
MGNEPDDDFSEQMPDEDAPTPEELAIWLSEYLTQSNHAQTMFRTNLCSLVVDKIWNDYGVEGMCELMIAIDRRAGWISDIIIEDADIHEVLFKEHNTFDNDAIIKARMSDSVVELNKKLWRLRRKYARVIAQEIVNHNSRPVTNEAGAPSTDEQ